MEDSLDVTWRLCTICSSIVSFHHTSNTWYKVFSSGTNYGYCHKRPCNSLCWLVVVSKVKFRVVDYWVGGRIKIVLQMYITLVVTTSVNEAGKHKLKPIWLLQPRLQYHKTVNLVMDQNSVQALHRATIAKLFTTPGHGLPNLAVETGTEHFCFPTQTCVVHHTSFYASQS